MIFPQLQLSSNCVKQLKQQDGLAIAQNLKNQICPWGKGDVMLYKL